MKTTFDTGKRIVQVTIPAGYRLDSNGFYINGHGVEYTLVAYGDTVCLETVYSEHTRTVRLDIAQ